jgi:hypothetical protein
LSRGCDAQRNLAVEEIETSFPVGRVVQLRGEAPPGRSEDVVERDAPIGEIGKRPAEESRIPRIVKSI